MFTILLDCLASYKCVRSWLFSIRYLV